MIVLHAGPKAAPLYFDPTKIVCVQQAEAGTRVWTIESTDPALVDEQPLEIIRLRAAWNRIGGAPTMEGSEPVAVELRGDSVIAYWAKTEVDTGE